MKIIVYFLPEVYVYSKRKYKSITNVVCHVSRLQDDTGDTFRRFFKVNCNSKKKLGQIACCRADLVESCCQKLNICDTNWLRYLAFIYLIICLSVWRLHLADLHIRKKKLEHLWIEKRYLKKGNGILLMIPTTC